jgi:NADH:quinone reductase (non-electrogenic)
VSGDTPHVVIIGGGFGGLDAARAFAGAAVRVTLLDRHNYHLFQPLLYQVATASLSPGDVASPIRWILRKQKNVQVLLAEARAIDPVNRGVFVDPGPSDAALPSISYDYLIVATGAAHSYFGHPEWAARAPGLKTLDDALEMRRRVLLAFEAAERETDPLRQRRLLTFVIVGGGPTGVELAGALAEIARSSLPQDFRSIRPESARIVLLEGGPDVLPAFPEKLRLASRRALERLGVEVRTASLVTGIDEDGVTYRSAEGPPKGGRHVREGASDSTRADGKDSPGADGKDSPGAAGKDSPGAAGKDSPGADGKDSPGADGKDSTWRPALAGPSDVRHISAETVLWAAGVAASPLAKSLGVPLDRAGRVTPAPTLAIPEHPEIFVAGDICAFTQDGKPLPGVAQVAMQQGAHAARNILRAIAGAPLEPFRYRNYGNMATIGRGSAVADIGPVKASGFLAWLFWLFLHIFWLIGFRNRLAVISEWAWAYVTFQRRVRLITGEKLWPH